MGDDAAEEQCYASDEPWQGVEMLIAPASGLRLPARRARPGALNPRDVQQESPGAGEYAKNRTADPWPRRHQPPKQEDRRGKDRTE
jgi:hypothetical protein